LQGGRTLQLDPTVTPTHIIVLVSVSGLDKSAAHSAVRNQDHKHGLYVYMRTTINKEPSVLKRFLFKHLTFKLTKSVARIKYMLLN
jgi:hypothetical protein